MWTKYVKSPDTAYMFSVGVASIQQETETVTLVQNLGIFYFLNMVKHPRCHITIILSVFSCLIEYCI